MCHALLNEGSERAQAAAAAAALWDLVANENDDSLSFASAGALALAPLIALLSDEVSAAARKDVLDVLEYLTSDASNRAEAAKLGYIRPS